MSIILWCIQHWNCILIFWKSCLAEDDTNGHQNENQNSNQDSEPGVNKEENEFETVQNSGGNTNKKDKKPSSHKDHSKNNSKKVETITSRVKSITPADVINNNNDSQKGFLEVKIKFI